MLGPRRSGRGRKIALPTVPLDSLSTLEQDVLAELARAKLTPSAVILTTDLFQRRKVQSWDAALLIQQVLLALNEQGLILFRLRGSDYVDIRLTQNGWHTLGYLTYFSEVGVGLRKMLARHSSVDDASRRTGDATDYKNHPFEAVGVGAIERKPLREHVLYYPDHAYLHTDQLLEIQEKQVATHSGYTPNPDGRAGFFRRHPDLEREAIRLRAQGHVNREIAEQLSRLADERITDEGVRQFLKGVTYADFNELMMSGQLDTKAEPSPSVEVTPTRVEDTRGLRTLLVELVAEAVVIPSSNGMAKAVFEKYGRREDDHNIVHLLFKLRNDNVLTFSESGQNGGRNVPTNVRLSDAEKRKREKAADAMIDTRPDVIEVAPAIVRAAVMHEERLDPNEFPLLFALREGVKREQGEHDAIEKLRTTAETLASVDEAAAELLLARAAERESGLHPLTDVEAEYLRYAGQE